MASAISFGDANHGFQAGIINGSVHTSFHLPAERPETPPLPSAVIPFVRDVDFVERREILDQLQTKCVAPGSRVALVGLGGVGKSQLAIELAYRIRERSPEKWVFWVHASNAARFEQSYRDIANCVKVPGRQNPKADIFQLVHDWLRDERKGRWVLVLDNVDDAYFLLNARVKGQGQPTSGFETTFRPLRDYLPYCKHGSILITSRNRDAALKLVEQRDVITVEPMDEIHALRLFEKKLGVQANSSDSTELVTALEYMPLAIVQAAAYISQRAPRCSVRKYLEEFRTSDHEKTTLLDYDAGQLRRDHDAKNAIIITWQISFNHIRRTKPSAADLLSLMSFFDRQGIPEALIRHQEDAQQAYSVSHRAKARPVRYLRRLFDRNKSSSKDQEKHQESDSDQGGLEDDLLMLRDYSFIAFVEEGATFEMHALVQLATRKWLEANSKLEYWKQHFISNLCAAFPMGDYENWAVCQTLFPHAKSAAAQRPEREDSLKDWASLLYKAACYASQIGNGVEAEAMSLHSMRTRKKILGLNHEDTLWSMAMVGHAYRLRGRWDAAEELEVQVMEIFKKKLGADHPDTLSSMGNLALTYRNQGRWDAAEELEVQVMETFKKKLGADHPYTLSSIANLALTYGNQGRWDAAEELDVQVMETRKKKLGADHLYTLSSIANLSSTYRNQGRWDAAEELQVQVMETCKKKLGADHPDTLGSMGNLASTYRNQGRWDAAEELEVQVMETFKKKLGDDHPDTLSSIGNLSSTYRNQGWWDAAEGLQVQVMETFKKKLGADHPYTLSSIANLALTYGNQGRWDAAEELEVQAMETRKKKLGADHPYTLSSMGNLASTYRNQGRLDAAEELELQVMETFKKKLGDDHPDTLSSMGNLSSTYRNQGRWDAAEGLQVQVMETFKKKLGADHPYTLNSMANLALTYGNQGRWNVAEELQVQAIETFKKKLGADHPDTLSIMANLASTYRNQGRLDAAEELNVQVMETRKKKLGADHPDTLTSMNNLSFTLKGQGLTNKAISLMEDCCKLRAVVLGPQHPCTISSREALATWRLEAIELSEQNNF